MTSYSVALFLVALLALACRQMAGGDGEDPYVSKRATMVKRQLAGRDIVMQKVLDAMGKVPRHKFVPSGLESAAYEDRPLPIGKGQTISQPYIVAFMTQAVKPAPGHVVLEIGTGSGYQAAVLGELVKEVYTIEIVTELGKRARQTLKDLGYGNIHVKLGDGYDGWPEKAPFDIIMLTAAPGKVPQPLFDQLKVGGVLIAPVGVYYQELIIYTRTEEGIEEKELLAVRFVPMTGKAEK